MLATWRMAKRVRRTLFAFGLNRRVLASCICTQNSRHGVIAFVTGVFEHMLLGTAEGNLSGPGLRVEDRIIHLEGVVDHVIRNAPESLGHLALVGNREGSHPLMAYAEITRDDDQRVTFPVADRVAEPCLEPLRSRADAGL